MGFHYSGQAPKEVTVIRSMVPINLIVYYPKTEEGQLELAKRVSDVHATAVTQRIKSLNCPTSQKLELLDAVIETVKESEMPFPAFYADNLSAALPFLQTTDWDSHFSRKRFLTHTKGFTVCPDADSLSIIHPYLICHFHLHQTFAVSAPAEPVRYIIDLLISAIPLIELGRLQNLPRGAQYKTMYVKRCIPHNGILRLGKDIQIAR